MGVYVEFQSANPRNDLMTEGTYLSVEREEDSGEWTRVYTDNDWETKFTWKRTNSLFGWSKVIIEWDIPQNERSGHYRICHFGHKKSIMVVWRHSADAPSLSWSLHHQETSLAKKKCGNLS